LEKSIVTTVSLVTTKSLGGIFFAIHGPMKSVGDIVQQQQSEDDEKN
jgi:hypothetical protein